MRRCAARRATPRALCRATLSACRQSAGRDCADRARACGPSPLAGAQHGAPLVDAQYGAPLEGALARRSAAGGCVSRFGHRVRFVPLRPASSSHRVRFVPSKTADGPRARRVRRGARRVGKGAVARSGAQAMSAVLSASSTRRAWRVGSLEARPPQRLAWPVGNLGGRSIGGLAAAGSASLVASRPASRRISSHLVASRPASSRISSHLVASRPASLCVRAPQSPRG